jgi:hypothetical protein
MYISMYVCIYVRIYVWMWLSEAELLKEEIRIPACPFGLAGLRELIRRRRRRPFYSNFDWLDYGLILLVN